MTALYTADDPAVAAIAAALPQVDAGNPPDLLRRWTMGELLAADRTQQWALRGVLLNPTYGMVGGEMKTLKSYVGTFLDLAMAAGVPLFDRFRVERAGPVVAYVGEGGRIPYTHRLERIARAMNVNLADVPLFPVFDVAPIGSERFKDTLSRDLQELEPVLVHLDPYYAYHGTSTDSRNLHEEGSLLTKLSGPCTDAGANLLVTNHFNQTGNGVTLTRITQAGGGEWSDTWILLSHREAPNVDTGRFRLNLEIGSRQWGGTTWELDLNVGRFDEDRAEFDGDITWELRRAAGNGNPAAKAAEIVAEHPGELTKEEIAKRIGGRLVDARRAVDTAESRGQIVPIRAARTRADGKPHTVWAYQPTSDPGQDGTEIQP